MPLEISTMHKFFLLDFQKLLAIRICLFFVLITSILFSTEEKKPRVTIITSVFKGDEFIEGFLADITRQTIFHECELLLINANSPGNEELIIKPYLAKYPNIIYEKLEKDPGIYAVWNMGLKKARADFVTNANVDDRRNPKCLEMHVKVLEENPSIDLVYSDYLITNQPNETFEHNSSPLTCVTHEFAPELMFLCLPGPEPMWRKALHERCGYFSEVFFCSGDLEMWNRAVSKNCIFKKVPGLCGLFYNNPNGLSNKRKEQIAIENQLIREAYRYMWIKQEKESPKIVSPKLWSILICTLEERQEKFNKIHEKLTKQIDTNQLNDQVEILYFKDKRGEHSVGLKRNDLIARSQGKYVSFIDDDDDVHERYIAIIHEKLLQNPDCVSLTGIITTNGQNPKKFIHSIAYDHYFENDGVYYRPPNHLNPIKREIAKQFLFPTINYGEDTNWAMQIAKTGLLKKEEIISEPYYFYLWEP